MTQFDYLPSSAWQKMRGKVALSCDNCARLTLSAKRDATARYGERRYLLMSFAVSVTNAYCRKPRKLFVKLEWTLKRLLASVIGSFSCDNIQSKDLEYLLFESISSHSRASCAAFITYRPNLNFLQIKITSSNYDRERA
jgi:hypothetical protein